VIPVIVSWSGGKDSALALQHALANPEFEVVGLLTTVTAPYDRVSMHGVRASLLRAQARALGLPVLQVTITANCSNEDYETALRTQLDALRTSGICDVVFGDLFLADVRAYRERLHARANINAHFPLWEQNTVELAHSFIDAGFAARLVCVDTKQLDEQFCGRLYDRDLLAELPDACDPCGERGEFHTFVFDGPIFNERVSFRTGETVNRDGFVFCDLIG
jgi:uncharacterized protein (TIGR00290 family)